jgi:hypothetical protein
MVIDDGPVHSLYAALFGTRRTFLSDRFLATTIGILSRLEDAFILIDENKQACIARFQTRPNSGSRFSMNATPGFIREFLADRTYSDIIAALCKHHSSSLIRCEDARVAHQRLQEAFDYRRI